MFHRIKVVPEAQIQGELLRVAYQSSGILSFSDRFLVDISMELALYTYIHCCLFFRYNVFYNTLIVTTRPATRQYIGGS
jgi:hypothetical protein